MSSIMVIIGQEHPELFALELGKIAELCLHSSSCKYKPISTNFGHYIYMTVRSRMSVIMVIIGPEYLELFALELGKIAELCLHSSIYKYHPISTKLGQNEYDHKISNEIYYGSNWTRAVVSYLSFK